MAKVKRVRITLELSNSFLKLLRANIQLGGIQTKVDEGAEMSPDQLITWLVYQEARGTYPEQIAVSIPVMNRGDCPEIIHDERKVFIGHFAIRSPNIGYGTVVLVGILRDLGFEDFSIAQRDVGSQLFDVNLGQNYLGGGDRARLEKRLKDIGAVIDG